MPEPLKAEIEREFEKKFPGHAYQELILKISAKRFLSSALIRAYEAGKKDREPMYTIPCSDAEHNTFWKSVVESPQWKAWEKESKRRFAATKYEDGKPVEPYELFFDVDECREVGWISDEHIAEFFKFIAQEKP